MNILWIRPTLDLANGGPVAGITHLASELRNLGHGCEVVTLDAPNTPIVDELAGFSHALGPSWGKYKLNIRLFRWLYKNVNRFDAVIVSGIWQFPSFAVWLSSKFLKFPYFVFVHGALEPWFKHTYPLKHIKKWLYWPWSEYWVLRDANGVLFTNDEERKSASKSFRLYSANEIVVNYGIRSPKGNKERQRELFLGKFPHLREKRLFLFLGRLHPVKGCDILLEAFSRVAETYPDIHLIMAGPDSSHIQPILMKQASQSGLDSRITWTGLLTGDLKWGAYHSADVFILPSHSENFGIVVAEALACSLPVLITNKVNIMKAVLEDKSGFVEPDNVDGIVRLFHRWMQLSPEERNVVRANALNSFLQRYEISLVAKNFITAIEKFLSNDLKR